MRITKLNKADWTKAVEFAIQGMHFNWYLDSPLLLHAYGKYFWYLEMGRATHVYAAYEGETFLGVLLAEIYGAKARGIAWYQKCYVRFVDAIQRIFFRGGADLYEHTARQQREEYAGRVTVDGEIIFLAADPEAKVRGIGTALLQAFEQENPGKRIFLHTDDACTYQFYEHRGFERVGEKDILMELPKGKVPLKCLLYSKVTGT